MFFKLPWSYFLAFLGPKYDTNFLFNKIGHVGCLKWVIWGAEFISELISEHLTAQSLLETHDILRHKLSGNMLRNEVLSCVHKSFLLYTMTPETKQFFYTFVYKL